MSKPLKYRKKPVVVEAMRFYADHLVMAEVAHWCGGRIGSETKASDHTDVAYWIDIPTLEGVMQARPGDYVIRGVQGEFYPCKPEIFESTYERAITLDELDASRHGMTLAELDESHD